MYVYVNPRDSQTVFVSMCSFVICKDVLVQNDILRVVLRDAVQDCLLDCDFYRAQDKWSK